MAFMASLVYSFIILVSCGFFGYRLAQVATFLFCRTCSATTRQNIFLGIAIIPILIASFILWPFVLDAYAVSMGFAEKPTVFERLSEVFYAFLKSFVAMHFF